VICQRKRLAFSSRTPGRTQALNFFAVGRDDAIEGFLVDTPGYGYAAAPGAIRETWDRLAGHYLHQRPALQGAVLMVDIRRLLTDRDRQMLGWLPVGTPLLVLLTKCDKLGTSQQASARREVLAQLGELPGGDAARVLLFSATARKGVDDARGAIEALLCGSGLPAAPAESAVRNRPKKTPTKGKVGV